MELTETLKGRDRADNTKTLEEMVSGYKFDKNRTYKPMDLRCSTYSKQKA